MPLRRRALTLSNVITNVESRLRSVELRPAPRGVQAASVGTDSIVNGSITASKLNINAQKLGANTGSTSSSSPNGHHSIVGISIPETVNLRRAQAMPVTVTTADAHGLVVGDVFSLYGVSEFPNTDTPWTITKVPTTTTLVFKPIFSAAMMAEYSSAGLSTDQVYATVATKACNTTTATLTFSDLGQTAYFQVGDIVTIAGVSTGSESFNGTFKITYVSSDYKTIKYIFPTTATVLHSTPVNVTGGKAYATLNQFHHVGDTYTDTSTTPPTVYVWDGTGWVDIHKVPDGVIVKDNINPGPPTNVSISNPSAVYNPNGTAIASCTLSWTAPSINADSTPITDLAGYMVQRRYGSSGAWVTVQSGLTATSLVIDNLYAGQVVNFQVFAIDSGGNMSTGATTSGTLANPATTLVAASVPILTSKLGTITVKWDGLTSGGALYDNSLQYLEVHQSTTNNFTPSDSTLIGTINGSAPGVYVAAGLAYSTTYYFCFMAVTYKSGVATKVGPSAYASQQVTPLVNADLIAKSLTVWPFADSTVDANALASGSVSASKLLAGAVTQTAIAANAIGADQIAANAIVSGKIAAGAVTASTIAAGAITADKIAANSITADQISAGYISSVRIDATQITAGTLTGFNVQSASSGQRVVMNGSQLSFYASSGTNAAHVYGNTDGGAVMLDSTGSFEVRVSPTGADIAGGGAAVAVSTNRIDLSATLTYVSGTINTGGITNTGGISSTGTIATGGGLQRTAYIGGGTTTASVDTNGTFIRTTSSARYKQDIEDISYDYAAVLSLKPKKFRLKNEAADDENSIFYPGFIAEELAGTALDIFVAYEKLPDGSRRPDGVRYAELTSALVGAIKHQDTIITSLEARLAAIEAKVA